MQARPDSVPFRRSLATIWMQIGIAGSALAWLLLVPPAQGEMLLVPLTGPAARALPALALQGDTRLIGTGPLPGSLLVYGRRAAILSSILRHGALAFAVPDGGCTAAARGVA